MSFTIVPDLIFFLSLPVYIYTELYPKLTLGLKMPKILIKLKWQTAYPWLPSTSLWGREKIDKKSAWENFEVSAMFMILSVVT